MEVPSAPNLAGSLSPSSSPKPLYQPTGTPLKSNATTLYNATCSNCGKPTKTIFEPKEGRPIYCKSCLKKMKAQKESASPRISIPVKEAAAAPSRSPSKSAGAAALSSLGIEFGPSPAAKPNGRSHLRHGSGAPK